jgi:plasmid stabilization system protein ParE
MRYWLHPEAENDLRDAAEFYRDRADSSLSQSLLAEFERSVDILLEHPGLGALWRSDRRRLIMKRFPYSLIYTVVGE